MKALSKAQAHMLAVTRLLGKVHHNSGFKGGIRTARVLAAQGLLDLREDESTGAWYGYIPLATLMNDAGMRWVDSDCRAFLQMGAQWAENFKGTDIKPRFYAAREWHDGRVYFLVKHPFTNEKVVVFADDLEIKGHDSE